MSDTAGPVHTALPSSNDLFAIKWADWVTPRPRDTPATPTIRLGLCAVDGARDVHQFCDRAPTDAVSDVHVTLLHEFPIGGLVQGGRVVGRLNLQRYDFSIQLPDRLLGTHGVMEREPPANATPSIGGFPQPLLSSEYRLLGWLDTRCLYLVDAKTGSEIVIPCYEVFRSLLAPHSEFASALLSGPWRQTAAANIIDPDKTWEHANGGLHVHLRYRIPDELAFFAGHLWLSKIGFTAASSIYAGLQHSPKGSLDARIPFENRTLNLNAYAIPLSPKKYLLTEIIEWWWPEPVKGLHVDRDNSNPKGSTETPSNDPKPFRTQPKTARNQSLGGTIDHGKEPNARIQPSTLASSTASITNKPGYQKVGKDVSREYAESGAGGVVSAPAPKDASAGRPKNSKTQTAPVEPQSSQQYAQPEEFSYLKELLSHLSGRGKIKDPVVIPPIQDHGEGSLWNLPSREPGKSEPDKSKWVRWAHADGGQNRNAFAIRFYAKSKFGQCRVIAIELERLRRNDSFRGLLMKGGNKPDDELVKQALLHALITRGIWKDATKKIQEQLGVTCVTWRHIKRTSSQIAKDREGTGGALTTPWSPESFTLALEKLVDGKR